MWNQESINQSIILFSDAGYKRGSHEADVDLQITKKCEIIYIIICKITLWYLNSVQVIGMKFIDN